MTEARAIHPTYSALEEALSAQPGGLGRPWAWLASIDPAFNVRVTQNWKYRGLPLDMETITRLADISGAPIERLVRSRGSNAQRWIKGPRALQADPNATTARSRSGAIWRLPVVPFENLELLPAATTELLVARLPTLDIWVDGVTPEANDKIIMLPFDVAGTEAKRGHIAVFRPVPSGAQPRPSNFPMVVKPRIGDQFHLTSYDVYMGGSAEAIAVCYHHYPPPRSIPFWD